MEINQRIVELEDKLADLLVESAKIEREIASTKSEIRELKVRKNAERDERIAKARGPSTHVWKQMNNMLDSEEARNLLWEDNITISRADLADFGKRGEIGQRFRGRWYFTPDEIADLAAKLKSTSSAGDTANQSGVPAD